MAVVHVPVQPEHGYLLFVVVLTLFVNFWAASKVGRARKLYNVPYPEMYAEKSDKNAKAFNCVQRAHQNMLEQIPLFLMLLFTAGIFRPQMAAIAGVVRVVGFILYVRGYSTGDPKKRSQGFVGYFGLLAHLVFTIEAGLRLLGYL